MKLHPSSSVSRNIQVYSKSKALNYNAIILVNGKMIAAGWKLKMGLISKGVLETQLFDSDTIVLLIAIGGG